MCVLQVTILEQEEKQPLHINFEQLCLNLLSELVVDVQESLLKVLGDRVQHDLPDQE